MLVTKQSVELTEGAAPKKTSIFKRFFNGMKKSDKKISLFDLITEYGFNSLDDLPKLPEEVLICPPV